MARVRNRQAGFTLIEIMFVVAIIALLAAVAIPMFSEASNKGKMKAEVSAFFSELGIREEQYKVEKAAYLAAAACPASVSIVGQSTTGCIASGQPWGPDVAGVVKLNVQLPMLTAYCSYVIVSGIGTGTSNPGGFTFASPAGPWFHMTATCDTAGDGGTNSTYFASSVDPMRRIGMEPCTLTVPWIRLPCPPSTRQARCRPRASPACASWRYRRRAERSSARSAR